MRNQVLTCVAACVVSVALSACGSKAPKPTAEIALASSALQSAEQSGARQLAPIELRKAREKQDAAAKAVKEEKYGKARYLSVEARVDAELARATADAERKRQELKRAQGNIDELRGDLIPTVNPE